MGVVSNKINIMELMKSGGGGDPTIPGRVSTLENEMTGVYASINQISTVELPKVYSSINEISTVELPKVYSSINANTQAILTGSVNMADKVKMNNNNPIRFGVDGDGNYGYIKVGADTVTPFLTGGGGIQYQIKNSDTTISTSTKRVFNGFNFDPVYFSIFPGATPTTLNTSSNYIMLINGNITDGVITGNGYRFEAGTYSPITQSSLFSSLTIEYDAVNKELSLEIHSVGALASYTFFSSVSRILIYG